MNKLLSKRSEFTSTSLTNLNKIADSLESKGQEVIRLNRGDPARYFPTPKHIIDAYIKALKKGKTYYSNPAGLNELRQAIANKYSKKRKGALNEKDVLITMGASEAIFMLNNCLINPNDKAILFAPYFPSFDTLLKLHGGIPILGHYHETNNWNLDLDELKEQLKKTNKQIKYLIMANPNNPTGTLLKKKELKEIVDFANEHKIFLVSDEVYDEIVYNNNNFTSLVEVAEGIPHMIINSASKVFDCTGLRVGFVVIPEQDTNSVALKEKMLDLAALRFSVNTPAQYAFLEGITNTKEHKKAIKIMTNTIENTSNYASKIINETKTMSVVPPNSTFYLFPKIDFKQTHFKNDVQFAETLLKEKHIKVSRGASFGIDSHIRITSLQQKEVLEKAINKMDSLLKKNRKIH